MAKQIVKPEPLHNPRMRYTVVYPDGHRLGQMVEVTGYLHDRQWLIDTQLHGCPVGTSIENLRQVDRRGRDLPKQPAILMADEPRTVEKFGHVPASAPDAKTPRALPPVGTKLPANVPRRPRRLIASDGAEQVVKDEGLEVYAGVPPYKPSEPSRALDHDEPDDATDGAEFERLEAEHAARMEDVVTDVPAVEVRGEPINPQDKPATQSKG